MSAFFGQVLINATNNSITVDGGPVSLTSAYYYIWKTSGGLCAHLASVIAAESGATVSASVSADGILTLTADAEVALTSFEAYDMFGFASDSVTLSGGAGVYTAVATKRLAPSWVPGVEPSDSAAPTSRQGKARPLVAQAQAADGTPYTTQVGSLVVQSLTFEYVSKAKTWNADSKRNSFEEFHAACADGRDLLYIPSWTGSGSYSTEWEYVLDLARSPEPDVKRQRAPTDMFWRVTLPLRGV